MNLLVMDTSTPLLLLGWKTPGASHSLVEDNGMNHASLLAPKIKTLAAQAGFSMEDIQGIGVVTGPGSFTGLRIGLSTAKGLAEALGVPLAGILNLDAAGFTLKDEPGSVAVVVDARKSRMYGRIYRGGEPVGEVFDLSAGHFLERFGKQELTVSGPSPEELFPPELRSPLWRFKSCRDWTPGLVHLTQEALKKGLVLGPGEGPYYHRMGEEDLGISLRNPKSAGPQVPGPQPGSA